VVRILGSVAAGCNKKIAIKVLMPVICANLRKKVLCINRFALKSDKLVVVAHRVPPFFLFRQLQSLWLSPIERRIFQLMR